MIFCYTELLFSRHSESDRTLVSSGTSRSEYLGIIRKKLREGKSSSFIWSNILLRVFGNSKLNLMVKFYENRSKEIILLKKEINSKFSIFWPHFRICTESTLQLFKNE